jgi:hypothetical protein
MTQVQRLSDDLRKSRTSSSTKTVGVMKTRQDREVDTNVKDMRAQMQQTNKLNSDLRNKVFGLFFYLRSRFNISSRCMKLKSESVLLMIIFHRELIRFF